MDGYTRFLEEAGELNQTEHQVHLDNGEYVPECLYCHAEGRNRDRRNQYSEAAQALLGSAYGRNPHLTIREAQDALKQIQKEAEQRGKNIGQAIGKALGWDACAEEVHKQTCCDITDDLIADNPYYSETSKAWKEQHGK